MQLEGPRTDDSAEQPTEQREATAPPPSATESDETSASPLDRFLPHSLRTGRGRVLRRDDPEGVPEAGEGPLEAPRQLGEVGAHVELVLAAAEQAAEQIRQEAREAASETRAEAALDAARIRQELEEAVRASERQRAEVEQYVAEAHTSADFKAEQTLRDAEVEAAGFRADAAREAGRIVAEAEHRAREIEEAARRRADELAEEAQAIEARLDELLATLRTVTHQLERRLAVDSPAEDHAEPESLDEALAPTEGGTQGDEVEAAAEGPSRETGAESRSKSA